ncbi:MAG: Ig-like domain-containing protein, partial [Clostridiales bacterium]|nr:Ig-like domain-containing protein [Clostridiales bacterium]
MVFKTKRLPFIISIAAAAAVVSVCAYLIIHNAGPAPEDTPPLPAEERPQIRLDIVADKDGPAGIEQDSGFIIISSEPVSAVQLSSRLSLDPQTSFTLVQRTENELYLQPEEALRPAYVYNVLLRENSYEPPVSWAFQTKDTFRLHKRHPADGSYWVPVNSGIELTFTQPVGDIAAYVSVFPDLPGRFEHFNDTTVVFIPGRDMEYDTDYTVTLAAGLPGLSGDTLGEDVSFSFRSEGGRDSWRYGFYPYDGLAETFTTFDPVFVKLYAGEGFAGADVQADIYRYPDLDAYLSAEEAGEKDTVSTDGLDKVASFKSQLIIPAESYDMAYLPLPENPGPGWYLVDMQVISEGYVQGRRTQKLLQITDISLYAQTANNQLLLWLNDAATGGALAGVSVRVGSLAAVSDDNGVALFDVPPPKQDADKERQYYWHYDTIWKKQVRIDMKDRQYGAYLDVYGESYKHWGKIYYTYVYTDRAAYQPNDTVRFWGMALPRISGAARPGSLDLEWTAGGLYPDGIKIDVNADGTFSGEIKLEKQASGWEELRFTLDGGFLCAADFTVMEYVKPVYTVALDLDKPYYRKGDTIQAQAELSFFDGTPAVGIDMGFSCWGYSGGYSTESQSGVTDAAGRCNASFSLRSGESWWPGYTYMDVFTQGAEDQRAYCQRQALIFPSNYMLENSFITGEEGYTFNVKGYGIDFTAVDSGEFNKSWDTKLLKGGTAELTGEARLYKVEYIRNKTGEFYDFINKVTVDRYEYERKESAVMTFSVDTENGRFTSEMLPYPDGEHAFYYIELSVAAPDGQRLTETCYTPNEYYYNWNVFSKNYSFSQDLDTGHAGYISRYGNYIEEEYDGNKYFSNSRSAYRSLKERASIRLTDQNGYLPAAGRMLYTVVGQKLHGYTVKDTASFDLEFLPEYSPNVLVMGAYFDGRHIFTVGSTELYYHFQDSELIIDVKPDKERYLPGDEVTLELKITDRGGNGQPARYLVSVADEAAFAVMDQEVKPLPRLYSSFYIHYNQYASYKQPYDFYGGAESGEGGGENTRRDFVDTVAFLSGQADEKGLATVKFRLADNLTSWRLTSIAFCEKNDGAVNMPLVGKDISNIYCGLPFFINQVINGRYLAGESVGLSLRGAGSAITSGDTVSYEVRLYGPGVESSQTAQAGAGDFLPVVFDPLPAGEYTMLIKAACGSYSDALELPVKVEESLLVTHRSQSGDLSGGLDIKARRFPVRLTLYDMDNRLFYDTLYNLLAAGGQRADQLLVRALAGKRLNALEGDSYYAEDPDISAEEINAWRYGLRIFPYAETDPLLTAKAAAVAGQFLNAPALKDYFLGMLTAEDSLTGDICAAYMGLAALREPILLELRGFFAKARDDEAFITEDKLHLAIGLALLGDHAAAGEWYEKNIRTALKSAGDTLYFASAKDAHRDYVITAGAAMLATLLNHPDHRGLLAYLNKQRSATYVPLLEIATYINKYDPKPESAAALSYSLNGPTVNVSFADRPQLYLELGEQQLQAADFRVEQGNVGYSAFYYGGLEETEKTLPQGVNISRSLSADTLKMGETLRVTTTVTFDDT